MISAQTNFSKWHHFSSVVLALDRTIRRSPRYPSLGNCSQPMHSVEPSSPSTHDQVQFLSYISLRHLHEMLEAVSELSNLLTHHQNRGLTSFDQSVRHIKSAWLLVTLQLRPDQAQPINVTLETLHHVIVLSTLSPCHNSENWPMN